ncbi:hypothetical protein NDU88_000158 [Pleurodeles waltl]|uniref:Secreted protein n=1 Tax=Pleurodeles waltl TaxID=8319 RepID=A0AAV7SVT0_PLEWA|nr:hypothetical protein NDU88_000158 [Pleurodeles waltl]
MSAVLVKWAHLLWIVDVTLIVYSTLDQDRSYPPLPTSHVLWVATQFSQWKQEWALRHCWQVQDLGAREFAHYSVPHDLHVRLDDMLSEPLQNRPSVQTCTPQRAHYWASSSAPSKRLEVLASLT